MELVQTNEYLRKLMYAPILNRNTKEFENDRELNELWNKSGRPEQDIVQCHNTWRHRVKLPKHMMLKVSRFKGYSKKGIQQKGTVYYCPECAKTYRPYK